MYNNVANVLKNRFGIVWNNHLKTRLFILGFGCSYVYTTGTILYMKVSRKMTEDSDRLEGLVHHFYTSNFASHLSPYMLPVFIRRGCTANIDKALRNEHSEVGERMYAYSALTRILSNSEAVKSISNKFSTMFENLDSNLNPVFMPFKSLVDSIYNPQKVTYKTRVRTDDGKPIYKTEEENETIFNLKMKAFENLLKISDPKDREFSYDEICKTVNMSKRYKSVPSKEVISRVLLLLFENSRNAEKVAEKEFEKYTNSPIIKTEENSEATEDDCPVLGYLYSNMFPNNSFSNVLSLKYPMVLNNSECIKELNKVLSKSFGSLPEVNLPFQSAFLQKYKTEINKFCTIIEISFCYSILRHLFEVKPPGVTVFRSIQNSLQSGLKTSRGFLLFELFYHYQEKFIRSPFYFNNQKNVIPLSFLVALSTFGSLALVCSTQRFFFFPLLLTRFVL